MCSRLICHDHSQAFASRLHGPWLCASYLDIILNKKTWLCAMLARRVFACCSCLSWNLIVRVLYPVERRLVLMTERASCGLWKMCSWVGDEGGQSWPECVAWNITLRSCQLRVGCNASCHTSAFPISPFLFHTPSNINKTLATMQRIFSSRPPLVLIDHP